MRRGSPSVYEVQFLDLDALPLNLELLHRIDSAVRKQFDVARYLLYGFEEAHLSEVTEEKFEHVSMCGFRFVLTEWWLGEKFVDVWMHSRPNLSAKASKAVSFTFGPSISPNDLHSADDLLHAIVLYQTGLALMRAMNGSVGVIHDDIEVGFGPFALLHGSSVVYPHQPLEDAIDHDGNAASKFKVFLESREKWRRSEELFNAEYSNKGFLSGPKLPASYSGFKRGCWNED